MENLDHVARSSPTQERRHRRFNLQYPVLLKAHSDCMVQVEAMTRNISIRGLLMETSSVIPQHTPVSFIVTVEQGPLGDPIQFAGEGKVERVALKAANHGFTIAVECRQPIMQSRLISR